MSLQISQKIEKSYTKNVCWNGAKSFDYRSKTIESSLKKVYLGNFEMKFSRQDNQDKKIKTR